MIVRKESCIILYTMNFLPNNLCNKIRLTKSFISNIL